MSAGSFFRLSHANRTRLMDGLRFVPILFLFVLLFAITGWMNERFIALSDKHEERIYLSSLTVPEQAEPIVIGFRELGQRPGPDSAERAHIELRWDGDWHIKNIARQRRLLLMFEDGSEHLARRVKLVADDAILDENGEVALRISELSATSVRLQTPSGETIQALTSGFPRKKLDVSSELVTAEAPNCPAKGANWPTFGGKANCPASNIFAVPGLPFGAFVLRPLDRGISIAPGTTDRGIRLERDGDIFQLRDYATPLQGAEGRIVKIVAGRTRYALTALEGSLLIEADDKRHLFADRSEFVGKPEKGLCQPPPLARTDEANYNEAERQRLRERLTDAASHVPLRPNEPGSSYAANDLVDKLCHIWEVETPLASAQGRWRTILMASGAFVLHWVFLAWRLPSDTGRVHMFGHCSLVAILAVLALVGLWWLDISPLRRLGLMNLVMLTLAVWSVGSAVRCPWRSMMAFSIFSLALQAILALSFLNFASFAAVTPNDGATRFLDNQILGLAILLSILPLWSVWAWCCQLFVGNSLVERGLDFVGRQTEGGSLAFGLILFFAGIVGIQAAFGSEEGVFGFQPVELAKPMAIILVAIFTATVLHAIDIPGGSFLLIRPFLYVLLSSVATAAIFLLVPALQGDFSPILVLSLGFLAAWIPRFAMAFRQKWQRGELGLLGSGLRRMVRFLRGRPFWRVAARQSSPNFIVRSTWWLWLFIAFLPIWVGYGVIFFTERGAKIAVELSSTSDFAETPRRRFQAWLEPDLHRDDSLQMRRSLALIAAADPEWADLGAFYQVEELHALRYHPKDPETLIEPARTPAAHDDFIGAVFVERFGFQFTGILLGLQFAMIASLWALSVIALAVDPEDDYRQRAWRRIAGVTAFGAGLLLAIHWAISWANVMGWAPIMGQPMTFLSAGSSHLIAVGGFAVVAVYAASMSIPKRTNHLIWRSLGEQ